MKPTLRISFVILLATALSTQAQITEIIDATGDGAGHTLAAPWATAIDGSGTVYVTGQVSHNAFKVTPGGVITEIIDATGDGAGNTLDAPSGIVVDGSGNVYLAGNGSHNAFKITPGGVITEIIDHAGDGAGNTLSNPMGIAVDGSGNVYIAGQATDNAFKITPGGVITEIIDHAGDGAGNTLDVPRAIAVDGSGNVYVTGFISNNAFKVTPGGVITEIIDATGDGAGHTLSGIHENGIVVDGPGNVYLTGALSNNAFKITPSGIIIQIIDATGDGAGHTLIRPEGIAVDAVGNVYVAAAITDNAFKITPGGVITEIIDGTGDGSGHTLESPKGLALDGNVYIGGFESHNVFKIPAALLPVAWATFTARAQGPEVRLTWQTLSETNNAGFEVQNHTGEDETMWQGLGYVEGQGTTAAPQSYTYHLTGLAPGPHRFRLKQMDFDGTYTYSEEVEVRIVVPGVYVLSSAYPNPFNAHSLFTLSVRETQSVRVAVFNVLGQEVALLHEGSLAGGHTHTFTLDGTSWSSGLYVYRVAGPTFTAHKGVTLFR